jgi:hypothetical protein
MLVHVQPGEDLELAGNERGNLKLNLAKLLELELELSSSISCGATLLILEAGPDIQDTCL